MLKKILLIAMALLITSASVYSFDPAGKGHAKGPAIKYNHWLLDKDVIEKLNYDSLWEAAAPIDKSQEGQKLIDDCINAYGGEENLSKVNSLKLEYDLDVTLLNKKQQIINEFQKGLKHKTICMENGDFQFERVLNNNKSWKETNDTTYVIDTHNFKKEMFDYLMLTMPLGMKTEKFSEVRYGRRAGDSLQYIYMMQPDSLVLAVGINPTDHLIHKTEGVVLHNEKRFVFISLFADFKDFDGYIFPTRRTNISMGLQVGDEVLTNVTINPDFAANNFDLID